MSLSLQIGTDESGKTVVTDTSVCLPSAFFIPLANVGPLDLQREPNHLTGHLVLLSIPAQQDSLLELVFPSSTVCRSNSGVLLSTAFSMLAGANR